MSLEMYGNLRSKYDDYFFDDALSLIVNKNFEAFKALLYQFNFFVDAYDNRLLHFACTIGQVEFVNELLSYPAVINTLSRKPDILLNLELKPEIIDALMNFLQKDFFLNNNYHFVEWLQSIGKREFAQLFQQEAKVKYGKCTQFAIEFKSNEEFNIIIPSEPYYPDFKRKRENVKHGIRKVFLDEPPIKKFKSTPS